MTYEIEAEPRFSFIADNLSLDFANTVSGRMLGEWSEKLTGYSDLVSWGLEAGAIDNSEAARLLEEALRRPAEASAVLRRATRLREAIYSIFFAVTRGKEPKRTAIKKFNEELSRAMTNALVAVSPSGFTWEWKRPAGALDSVLWPVARSAADLLVSGDLERVKECAGDTCGWLFVDTTRNHSRHWCDMRDCGNRAKAKRHYRRVKESAGAEDEE